MKKNISYLISATLVMTLLVGCGGSKKNDNRVSNEVDALVSDYGYQWTDTSAPILNETGAKEL